MKIRFLVLLLAGMFVTGMANGQLFTNLVINDQHEDSGDPVPVDAFTVETNLQPGDLTYNDRNRTFPEDGIPEFLLGAEWIRGANNVGDNTFDDPVLTFTMTADATIYICTDDRGNDVDGWTDPWTDTGEDIATGDGDQPFQDILARDFSDGDDVELGNWVAGNFYFIIFVPTGPTGPNLTLNVEGATFAEEGGDITLSANDDMMAPFQWKLDGGDLGGETDATLALSPTEIGDSGVYTLEFDDGVAKATLTSNPVSVAIFAEGTLPVTSLLGLGLLAVMSALAGGTVLVRMKK